jgi:hypothetical protein
MGEFIVENETVGVLEQIVKEILDENIYPQNEYNF